MTNDYRSEVEALIESMISGDAQATENNDLVETVTIEEGEDVICPDCGSHNMVEGFVESDGEACLAYACDDCGTKLVSDQSYDFGADEDKSMDEALIDPNNPCCPLCDSEDLSHQVVESEDGNKDLILDCDSCGASMVVIPE